MPGGGPATAILAQTSDEGASTLNNLPRPGGVAMPGGGPLAPGYELYVGGGPKPGTGETPEVSLLPLDSSGAKRGFTSQTLTSTVRVIGHDGLLAQDGVIAYRIYTSYSISLGARRDVVQREAS